MTNSKTLQKIDWLIIASLALLALVLYFTQISDFDVKIQNHFFDFEKKKWLIDKSEPVAKFFFYQLPKIFFAATIIVSLAAVILKKNRQKALLIFLGLSLIPLIVGNIKKFTNIYCPTQLEIFDGDRPYVKIFSKYPQNFQNEKAGKCFPAGHAITGFAFFILCFVFAKKSHQIFTFVAVTIYGWILGFYQILKGAHFVSDTLVSMLACFLMAALIAKIYETRLAKTSLKN
jgi:membrane-associated PAP2 superfamily phosphatase